MRYTNQYRDSARSRSLALKKYKMELFGLDLNDTNTFDKSLLQPPTKLAYKGFNADLTCRGFQYKIGETFTYDKSLWICNRGFHCCHKLKDVFKYYSNNKKNVFGIVEILGKEVKDSDKIATDKIRIVRLLSDEEISEIIKKEEEVFNETEVFNLDVVRDLQSKFNMFLGGSTALFIQGIVLERKKGECDLDIILPYYQNLEELTKTDTIDEIVEFDGKSSSNDFHKTYGISTSDGRFIKADVRVKPEQPYTTFKKGDFEYKVCDPLIILEAKMRYALDGNKKHRNDLESLIGFKSKK